MRKISIFVLVVLLAGLFSATNAQAQDEQIFEENSAEESVDETAELRADAGPGRKTLTNKQISFDASSSEIPENQDVEVLWDFGDGVRTTGNQVSHSYERPGSYLVRLTVSTEEKTEEDTLEVRVFERVLVLLADHSASQESLDLFEQQAAEEGLLLLVLRSKSGSPDALVEDELAQLLLNSQEEIKAAQVVAAWTSGSIGVNALSQFAQAIKQADSVSFTDLNISNLGLVVLSETPFAVLSRTAQTTFDQLEPSYILLTRPDALSLLFETDTAEDAKEMILNSPIGHRLLGTFSSRAVTEIGPTNFVSFGINYLVNQGVPVSNILLVLLIPVIATILAAARQVVGIKAFGIITPAMTTLSFLVLGLPTGLLVFVVVLLSGTLTRIMLRRFRLLYLPRMSLVLTNASLAILVLFSVSAALGQVSNFTFSVFPILIMTILAEEFIAVQFSRGLKLALQTTAWTLLLVIICYSIVSWQLVRTLLLSYPELILLAIPANIALGRFTGLRITEYIRFRKLLRYGNSRS